MSVGFVNREWDGTWEGRSESGVKIPSETFPVDHLRGMVVKDATEGLRGRTLYMPHLRNTNLLKYMEAYQFSPSNDAVEKYMGAARTLREAVVEKVNIRQTQVHAKMLEQGSVSVCQGAVHVNDIVRIPVFDKSTKAPIPDEDGAFKWDPTPQKVVEVVRPNAKSIFKKNAAPADVVRYKIRDYPHLLYRYQVCPVDSVGIGRIVRIKQDVETDVGKSIGGAVKSREGQMKYMHVFTRSLYLVKGAVVEYQDGRQESTETQEGLVRLRMKPSVEKVRYDLHLVFGAFWPHGGKVPYFEFTSHEANLEKQGPFAAYNLLMCDMWIQKMFVKGVALKTPNGRGELFVYDGEESGEKPTLRRNEKGLTGWHDYAALMLRTKVVPARRTYQVRGTRGYAAIAAQIQKTKGRGDHTSKQKAFVDADFLEFIINTNFID